MEESNSSILIRYLFFIYYFYNYFSDSRNSYDIHSLYQDSSAFERLITIRASTIEAVSSAERTISYKLRNYYESDINTGVSLI